MIIPMAALEIYTYTVLFIVVGGTVMAMIRS